jgi:membrane-associated protease RseP (regulator of RpoE activity)
VFQAFEWLVWGALPDGDTLSIHPMGLAAWFGLLATALNLFPLGQLDGGHVAYAVFGSRARWITLGTAAASIMLAVTSLSWLAWAALVVGMTAVTGAGHPPTLDDALALDRPRRVLAVVAAVVFLLCFTPAPLEPLDAGPRERDQRRSESRLLPGEQVARGRPAA